MLPRPALSHSVAVTTAPEPQVKEGPPRWALFLPAEAELAQASTPGWPGPLPGLCLCDRTHSGRGAGLPARTPDTRPAPALDEAFWQLLRKQHSHFFPFHVKIQLEFFSSRSVISFQIFLAFISRYTLARVCAHTQHTHTRVHTRAHTHAGTDDLPGSGRWGGGRRVLVEGGADETWVQTFQKPLQNIWVCQNPKPPFARHFSR